MLRCTYLAFHVGKQFFVIGDIHCKNLTVDYTLRWGGNKNAVKKCQLHLPVSFQGYVLAEVLFGARRAPRCRATGAVNDWPLL